MENIEIFKTPLDTFISVLLFKISHSFIQIYIFSKAIKAKFLYVYCLLNVKKEENNQVEKEKQNIS